MLNRLRVWLFNYAVLRTLSASKDNLMNAEAILWKRRTVMAEYVHKWASKTLHTKYSRQLHTCHMVRHTHIQHFWQQITRQLSLPLKQPIPPFPSVCLFGDPLEMDITKKNIRTYLTTLAGEIRNKEYHQSHSIEMVHNQSI